LFLRPTPPTHHLQIFGVRMNEIMLFNANRRVRSVHNSDGLDARGRSPSSVPSEDSYFTDMKRSPEYFTWIRVAPLID